MRGEINYLSSIPKVSRIVIPNDTTDANQIQELLFL